MSNLDWAARTSSAEAAPPPDASALELEVIYDQYADFVWRNARRLGIGEAALDDVVQDVFVIAHRKLPSLQRSECLRAWLYSILVLVVRNHQRGLRRKEPSRRFVGEGTDPERVPASSRSNPQRRAEQSDAARIMHGLLLELSEEQREVFVLAELEEMSASEIAAVLELNANTVHSRLRAARHEFNAAVLRYRARDEWRLR